MASNPTADDVALVERWLYRPVNALDYECYQLSQAARLNVSDSSRPSIDCYSLDNSQFQWCARLAGTVTGATPVVDTDTVPIGGLPSGFHDWFYLWCCLADRGVPPQLARQVLEHQLSSLTPMAQDLWLAYHAMMASIESLPALLAVGRLDETWDRHLTNRWTFAEVLELLIQRLASIWTKPAAPETAQLNQVCAAFPEAFETPESASLKIDPQNGTTVGEILAAHRHLARALPEIAWTAQNHWWRSCCFLYREPNKSVGLLITDSQLLTTVQSLETYLIDYPDGYFTRISLPLNLILDITRLDLLTRATILHLRDQVWPIAEWLFRLCPALLALGPFSIHYDINIQMLQAYRDYLTTVRSLPSAKSDWTVGRLYLVSPPQRRSGNELQQLVASLGSLG